MASARRSINMTYGSAGSRGVLISHRPASQPGADDVIFVGIAWLIIILLTAAEYP